MGHKKSKKHSTLTPRQPEPEPEPEPNNDDQPSDYVAAPANDVEAEPTAAAPKPLIVACLPARKHPAEENEQDTPSSKRFKESSQDDSKKLIQRIFTEDDEAEILKGLLEFKALKGEDSDSIKRDDEFFEFVKNKLHVEVTQAQVMNKLNKLKKRFVNAKKKKHLTYDEKKFFDWSKKIWGVENYDNAEEIKVDTEDNNGVSACKKVDEFEAKDEDDNNGGVGEEEVKAMMRVEALKQMGEKGRAELREMWRKVEMAQMRVDYMRCEAQMAENQRIMKALGFVNSTSS